MTRSLTVLALVIAAIGGSIANDPARIELPRPARPVADNANQRTDRFGDPLPDGVLVRLGTIRAGEHRRLRHPARRNGGDREPGGRGQHLAAESRTTQ